MSRHKIAQTEEWWVLVEPKTNTWAQVSREDAQRFPAAQCLSLVPFPVSTVEVLFTEEFAH